MGAILELLIKRGLLLLAIGTAFIKATSAEPLAIPYSFTWVDGSENGGILSPGHYGTKGVADELNHPAGRFGAITWTDLNGNTWLYGGYDRDAAATPEEAFQQRHTSYSDMWKRDAVTGEWTWVAGPQSPIDEAPMYGTQGVFADGHTPGALATPRQKLEAVTLTNAEGHLWLFYRMELWKFNPETAQWAWMFSFPTEVSYGQKGIPAATNSPGLRSGSTMWLDEQGGNIWLSGGATIPPGFFLIATQYRTDVWKFSFATGLWTWVHGPDTISLTANYGTKGVADDANFPGSRDDAASWIDASGNLWMFGGYGYNDQQGSYRGRLNDVWKFDVQSNRWTWVSGTKELSHPGTTGSQGQSSPDYIPSARYGHSAWKDSDGTIWIFGGKNADTGIFAVVSDLWKYEPAVNTWSWVSGPIGTQNTNRYVRPGFASALNQPAARTDQTAWVSGSGELYMFGGTSPVSTVERVHSDLWSLDPESGWWTFHRGSKAVNESVSYGTPGVANATNDPGSRHMAATWTDLDGNLWLFSGRTHDTEAGIGTRYMSDLWKYDTALRQWIFMKGDTVPQNDGVYGQMGVEHPDNLPPVRINAVTWIDGQGRFWMYGGDHISRVFQTWFLSDLWMYNPATNNWTWVGGTNERNYMGNLDPAGPQDKPSARVGASGWTDSSGENLYMFGGHLRIFTGGLIEQYFHRYQMNDLWRFHIPTKQWHLVQQNDLTSHTADMPFGSRYFGGLGQYGVKGEPGTSNKPGGRSEAVAVTAPDGKFWLFGGKGYGAESPEEMHLAGGRLNDLWQYDPGNGTWTWVSGSDDYDTSSTFATGGAPSSLNEPAGRYSASGWAHPSGNLLVFGGHVGLETHPNVRWEYLPENNAWAWVENPDGHTYFGHYGGRNDLENYPGLRKEAMAWTTTAGEMWLFGGEGYSRWGYGMLNDLWRMSPDRAAAQHWELYD